jgi:hypothetical protein
VVAAAIGILLLARLVMAWRNPRSHPLFDSWSGFDLGVRSLVLERKAGSVLSIFHRGTDRSVTIERLPDRDGRLSLKVIVPDASSEGLCASRLAQAVSDEVSASNSPQPGIALDVEIYGAGESLVAQAVRVVHRCFLAMDVGASDYFKMKLTGEYDLEYFRDASEEFLEHDNWMVRASGRLSNAMAKRHIRIQNRKTVRSSKKNKTK